MTEHTDAARHETSFGRDLTIFIRHHLRGWRGLLAAGVLLSGPALWLGGPWLVAAGGLSLLVSVAPCLVMCGLGLCMMKSCDKKTNAGQDAAKGADVAASEAVSSAPAPPPVPGAQVTTQVEEPASR